MIKVKRKVKNKRAYIIAIFFIAILTMTRISLADEGEKDRDTFYSDYGATRTHDIVVDVGEHRFEVDGIAQYRLTQWWVNDQWLGEGENDLSGFWAIDPDYTRYINSATTIEAKVYYDAGGYWAFEESHTWNITIALPDLIVSDISISPNPPISGQSVTITATLRNQGNADAGAFNIRYYIDGSSIGTDRVSFGLNPGESDNEQITYSSYLSPGDHTVSVLVDCDNEVPESNENNNLRQETYNWLDTQAPTVEVINPNGGEVWDVGSTHNINWNRSDNVGITANKLEYSTNGGSSWIIIRDWTNGNPNSYPWTIPNTPSTTCRVKVS